jgi:hypothetical protein
MICPNCNKEQPEGNRECQRCGIIFAKWEQAAERQEIIPRPPVESPPSSDNKKTVSPTNLQGKMVFMLKLLCVVGVIYGWYWYMVPVQGDPVAENAYRDEDNNFALVVPEGWESQKVKKCGGKYNECEVFATYKNMGEQQIKPSVNVVVLDLSNVNPIFSKGSVSFTEKNKDEYAQEAVKNISSVFETYQLDESAIFKIDGIPSLSISGSGMIAGNHLRGSFVMIPSSSHLFALSFAGPEDYHPFFRGIVKSFQVTANRPNRFQLDGGLFGSVKGDLIMGLLIGLTIAIIKFLTWSSPLKSD